MSMPSLIGRIRSLWWEPGGTVRDGPGHGAVQPRAESSLGAARGLRYPAEECEGLPLQPQSSATGTCIRLIHALPEQGARLPSRSGNPALELARTLLRRSEDVVFRLRGREPGDHQAVAMYQQHVALAYYGVVGGTGPVGQASMPLEGSAWSREQLLQLRDIGLRHGAQVRSAGLGAVQPGSGDRG